VSRPALVLRNLPSKLAEMSSRPSKGAELAIVAWAVLGVVAILVQAIVRLLPRAIEPILDGSLGVPGAIGYALSILILGYSEGYRGFQQRFSPRVVVRALAVAEGRVARRRAWLVAFAPLMAMGLIHATRRRMIGSWSLLLVIVGLILFVRTLDQPWRGAVDAGVIVGLSWGALATLVFALRALRGQPPEVESDLPK
jgi:hypothetical protein